MKDEHLKKWYKKRFGKVSRKPAPKSWDNISNALGMGGVAYKKQFEQISGKPKSNAWDNVSEALGEPEFIYKNRFSKLSYPAPEGAWSAILTGLVSVRRKNILYRALGVMALILFWVANTTFLNIDLKYKNIANQTINEQTIVPVIAEEKQIKEQSALQVDVPNYQEKIVGKQENDLKEISSQKNILKENDAYYQEGIVRKEEPLLTEKPETPNNEPAFEQVTTQESIEEELLANNDIETTNKEASIELFKGEGKEIGRIASLPAVYLPILIDFSPVLPVNDYEDAIEQIPYSTRLYAGASFSYKNNWLLSPTLAKSSSNENLSFLTSSNKLVFGAMVSERTSLELNIMFSETKGQKINVHSNTENLTKERILNYSNFDFLYKRNISTLKINKNYPTYLTLIAGAYYANLEYSKEMVNNVKVENSAIQSYDVGVNLGLGYTVPIKKQWMIGFEIMTSTGLVNTAVEIQNSFTDNDRLYNFSSGITIGLKHFISK